MSQAEGHIRLATPNDFGTILALNHEWVRFLSPLDAQRLASLHAEAAYHRVVEVDGEVVAFLLAFREGCQYDSVNYRWFVPRYPAFLYVDRIVISGTRQSQGWGARLYRDLFEFAARHGAPVVTCEIDADPPNPTSRRFHERFGFVEVGQQRVAGGTKQVSLQAAQVASPAVSRSTQCRT